MAIEELREKFEVMSGKERLAKFRKLVQNEPLLEVKPSLAGIDPRIQEIEKPSLYYGTGLCTPIELSAEFPFDILSMVFLAEKLRRELSLDQIYHHIADTHAKSNVQFNPKEIDKLAEKTTTKFLRIAKNLGLKNFNVVLSSEFDQTPDYMRVLQEAETDKHEYVKREIADMEWCRRRKNVYVKVGWIIQATETDLGSDERIFDREYRKVFDGGISFLYLKAGRTLDRVRPKASPYIHVPSEHRILLTKGEDVESKLAEAEKEFGGKGLGGARKHLINIVREYENLFGSLGKMSIEDKIATVIERVCS